MVSLEHFLLPPQAVSTPSSPLRTEAVAGAQDEYAEDSSDEEVGRRFGQGRAGERGASPRAAEWASGPGPIPGLEE